MEIENTSLHATVGRRTFLSAGAALTIAGTGHARRDSGAAALAALERHHGGRLGVHALDMHTGRTLGYRADESFKLMSSFKGLLAALVLSNVSKGRDSLQSPVRYGPSDLMAASPVTQANVARGSMTVRELCEAIMLRSDNAAANLLMRRSGGPAGLTAFLRSIGDRVTRIDTYEGHLTDHPLPADSSTPRAVTETVRRILCGPVLPIAGRRLWEGWMAGNIVGRARLRASFPANWIAGDRTGTGDGICNDFAFARRPGIAPLLLSAYYTAPGSELPDQEAVLRAVSRLVVTWQTARE
ncbi:class A beta-lactamase [Sphingomonas sp. PAMC 26617]|uniref:class A beta-lactamase n=1 Tax=Sphingomonas sp. PAMC 26617 TaxID=1112216 RepID=UPI0002881974|nr:class A beta-lactamase [Sphingomonas sp. PAMC 26617]